MTAEPRTARIVIADDDPIVRDTLALYLADADDLEVVAQAGSGPEAVAIAQRTRPDLVLMDVQMPGGDGISATRAIIGSVPGTSVIILTTFDTDEAMLGALAAGARGFLLKDVEPRALVEVVRSALASGSTVIAPQPASRMAKSLHVPDPAQPPAATPPSGPGSEAVQPKDRARALGLTNREMDVLIQLCQAASNAEICERLELREPTVKGYLASLFMKLGVNSRLKAVVRAFELGLIDLPSTPAAEG